MAETTLSIQDYSAIKVRVEPTNIRGAGTPEYTRLVVPLNLSVSPIKEFKRIGSEEQGKPFVILDIKGSLFIQGSSQEISETQILGVLKQVEGGRLRKQKGQVYFLDIKSWFCYIFTPWRAPYA
jgi:hypothetical protein